MVNLERISSAERLDLCRKYFFIGLGFLPIVWLVNSFWFYRFAFSSNNNAETKSLKKYVILSMIGLAVWIILISVWLYIYTVSRAERSEWAEWLTFIIPLGRV